MNIPRLSRGVIRGSFSTTRVGNTSRSAILAQQQKGGHCVPDPDCPSGFSRIFCPSFDPGECMETGICCTPPPAPIRCGSCNPGTFLQDCFDPATNTSFQRPCTHCTVDDNRVCLPPPFDFICWGSCTRTCCRRESSDQILCGISPC